MTSLILTACLVSGIPLGVCRAETTTTNLEPWATDTLALTPSWATESWQRYAAGIVAGETVPGCSLCDLWIACTIRRDVERGYSPWRLHPGRWHGWREPHESHREAIRMALTPDGCDEIPHCRYLGNVRDFQYNWASRGPGYVIGNTRGLIVCVP